MARPRFHRLAETQQRVILDAALREFAAHGYRDASLNRIIEAAGISKGSMYYYFDGKEDLYVDVTRAQLEAMVRQEGPAPMPSGTDPDAFWTGLEDYYLRLTRLLAASPDTAALLRDWLTGAAPSTLRHGVEEAEAAVLPWVMRTLAAGQDAGAIRTDAPSELLIAITMGMAQAMDTWLIARSPDDAGLADAVHLLIDMMRRALAP